MPRLRWSATRRTISWPGPGPVPGGLTIIVKHTSGDCSLERPDAARRPGPKQVMADSLPRSASAMPNVAVRRALSKLAPGPSPTHYLAARPTRPVPAQRAIPRPGACCGTCLRESVPFVDKAPVVSCGPGLLRTNGIYLCSESHVQELRATAAEFAGAPPDRPTNTRARSARAWWPTPLASYSWDIANCEGPLRGDSV